MKGYLFAVFLLTICVVFVESAPTQNDESPTRHISTLVCDLGVTPKSARCKDPDESSATSVHLMEG